MCLFILPTWASAATLSRGYHVTTGAIPNGSIVSLDPPGSDSITAADSNNGRRIAGVTVGGSGALLAVDPSASTVQVVSTGKVPVLVSTFNGAIAAGDSVSLSPLGGVGMKAEASLPVIGRASESFTASSPNTTNQQVMDKQGRVTGISVGYLLVDIDLGAAVANTMYNLNGLQIFFKTLTGHVVSTVRIVSSIVITAIALLALFVLMYASVYGSIISIGRNPLAKYAVLHGLKAFVMLAFLMVALTAGIDTLLLR
jgi:hypothetical protein